MKSSKTPKSKKENIYTKCTNCRQEILKEKMFLHEGFCFRNNVFCEHCGKIFLKKDYEEHKNRLSKNSNINKNDSLSQSTKSESLKQNLDENIFENSMKLNNVPSTEFIHMPITELFHINQPIIISEQGQIVSGRNNNECLLPYLGIKTLLNSKGSDLGNKFLDDMINQGEIFKEHNLLTRNSYIIENNESAININDAINKYGIYKHGNYDYDRNLINENCTKENKKEEKEFLKQNNIIINNNIINYNSHGGNNKTIETPKNIKYYKKIYKKKGSDSIPKDTKKTIISYSGIKEPKDSNSKKNAIINENLIVLPKKNNRTINKIPKPNKKSINSFLFENIISDNIEELGLDEEKKKKKKRQLNSPTIDIINNRNKLIGNSTFDKKMKGDRASKEDLKRKMLFKENSFKKLKNNFPEDSKKELNGQKHKKNNLSIFSNDSNKNKKIKLLVAISPK